MDALRVPVEHVDSLYTPQAPTTRPDDTNQTDDIFMGLGSRGRGSAVHQAQASQRRAVDRLPMSLEVR